MDMQREPLGAPPSLAASDASLKPLWRSRGYLPHLHQSGIVQSITYRLHDSLPAAKLEAWQEELRQQPDSERERKLRAFVDAYLDAGHGECWLRDHAIARLVEDALHFHDQRHYRLLAWCVMPNHVHVLIETLSSWDLGTIVHSWKGFPAQKANQMLGRSGEFWQREYFDRFIRDSDHYENVLRYIENNPVKAGLVDAAEQWSFSSARHPRRMTSRPFIDNA